jgi:flagellar biosynthesis chaperone FliJ
MTMTMESRNRRVEMLLKVRQQEEDAARRAFDEANARANFHRQRVAETERLLVEHSRAAGQDVTASPRASSTAGYRRIATELRGVMGEQSALLRQLDPMLRTCRQELLEAMNRRKAAQSLRDSLVRLAAQGEEQAVTARLDETHAARAAGSGQ